MDKDDMYAMARGCGDKATCHRLLSDLAPRDYFVSHVGIQSAIRTLFPPPSLCYRSPFVFSQVPFTLTEWTRRMVQEPVRRIPTLVLFGPSQMHKTAWSRSLGPHDYFKGRIDPTVTDPNSQYRVLDDIVQLNKLDIRSWLGGDEFTCTAKYKPVIIIVNTLPRFSREDFDWWISNTIRYNVIVPII